MQTTGIFRVAKFRIPCSIGVPISLYAFGDVHKSSPLHSKNHWGEFLEEAKADSNALYIGTGDYDDFMSTSERRIVLNPDLHESTRQTVEDVFTQNVKSFVSDIEFMKGRLIGLIEGNHYGEYKNGTTTTQKMAEIMGTDYLGVCSFVRLIFEYSTRVSTVDLFLHHGKGAARLLGGSLNRVQQMAEQAEADIYFMGHDHKIVAGRGTRLFLSEAGGKLNVKHRDQLFLRTGSFLRGYVDGHASYVVDAGMNPAQIGAVKVILTPRRTRAGGEDDFKIEFNGVI